LVGKKTARIVFKPSQFPIPQYHPDDLLGDGGLPVYEKLEKI
jgi:hypothetical protein